jgi:hypothetical protein
VFALLKLGKMLLRLPNSLLEIACLVLSIGRAELFKLFCCAKNAFSASEAAGKGENRTHYEKCVVGSFVHGSNNCKGPA